MTAEEADLIQAAGRGRELFDDPTVFFLTHAETIRRWNALGTDARAATNAFLDTLETDLEELERVSRWQTQVADTARSYRHLLFSPQGTPGAEDDTPRIACCFGWNQRRVRVTPHAYTPFVGVRVAPGRDREEWRSTFLGGEGSTTRNLVRALGYQRDREWPAWKQVTGGTSWWADLDSYRASVVAAFEECLDAFAGEVERTVAAMTNPGRSVDR